MEGLVIDFYVDNISYEDCICSYCGSNAGWARSLEMEAIFLASVYIILSPRLLIAIS